MQIEAVNRKLVDLTVCLDNHTWTIVGTHAITCNHALQDENVDLRKYIDRLLVQVRLTLYGKMLPESIWIIHSIILLLTNISCRCTQLLQLDVGAIERAACD